MFVRSSAKRWLVVTVAAYAMVLHALVMGLVSAPRAAAGEGQGFVAALQELCSGGYLANSPDDPDGGVPRTMPCSLCSLGHAAADIPSVLRVALPVNIIETVAREPARDPARPRLDFLSEARPRAPPAVG